MFQAILQLSFLTLIASGTVMEEQLNRRRRESADTVQVTAWLVYIQKPRPPELSFSHKFLFSFSQDDAAKTFPEPSLISPHRIGVCTNGFIPLFFKLLLIVQ